MRLYDRATKYSRWLYEIFEGLIPFHPVSIGMGVVTNPLPPSELKIALDAHDIPPGEFYNKCLRLLIKLESYWLSWKRKKETETKPKKSRRG